MYIVCILWFGGECACAKRQHVFSANINLQTAHVFPVSGYACVWASVSSRCVCMCVPEVFAQCVHLSRVSLLCLPPPSSPLSSVSSLACLFSLLSLLWLLSPLLFFAFLSSLSFVASCSSLSFVSLLPPLSSLLCLLSLLYLLSPLSPISRLSPLSPVSRLSSVSCLSSRFCLLSLPPLWHRVCNT